MGGQFTPESALGILSLVFWTLVPTVSVKYCAFVMRADNHGAGGIMALMSLVGANSFKSGAPVPHPARPSHRSTRAPRPPRPASHALPILLDLP